MCVFPSTTAEQIFGVAFTKMSNTLLGLLWSDVILPQQKKTAPGGWDLLIDGGVSLLFPNYDRMRLFHAPIIRMLPSPHHYFVNIKCA